RIPLAHRILTSAALTAFDAKGSTKIRAAMSDLLIIEPPAHPSVQPSAQVQGGHDTPRLAPEICRFHSIQALELLRATAEADLGGVQVALGIDADVVHPLELPGHASAATP